MFFFGCGVWRQAGKERLEINTALRNVRLVTPARILCYSFKLAFSHIKAGHRLESVVLLSIQKKFSTKGDEGQQTESMIQMSACFLGLSIAYEAQ
jgi:hypothetical protein